MTSGEQEELLRFAFELVIHDTTDPETIRRRALFMGQVFDCPSAMEIPPAELAQILGVSRQAVYKAVDKLAAEVAEIKGNFADS